MPAPNMHRHPLLFVLISYAMLAACIPAGSPPPSPVTQIYQFSDATFVENLHVLPSGHVLLTTLSTGHLFSVDPKAHNPTPGIVATLGNTTALTGIAALPGNSLYAVTGGTHTSFGFLPGSMSLFVVLITQLPNKAPRGHVVTSIPFPDTSIMNGLDALPKQPLTLLSADSIGGRILRINTLTGQTDVAWSDPAIGSGNPSLPLGINGLKIVGDFLYFTNSGQGTFGRVPIDKFGNKVGAAQILATLPSPSNLSYAFDDFDFDRCGNAYVALHDTQVIKITPGGVQSVFAGGLGGVPPFRSPTSVATANDGKSIYVSTGGDRTATPPGGQLLSVKLPVPNNC
ncbi:hypothetical protein V8F06_012505 [Rhypophila decipiens]